MVDRLIVADNQEMKPGNPVFTAPLDVLGEIEYIGGGDFFPLQPLRDGGLHHKKATDYGHPRPFQYSRDPVFVLAQSPTAEGVM